MNNTNLLQIKYTQYNLKINTILKNVRQKKIIKRGID